MVYKDFKNIKLSRLGLGCMRLPRAEEGSATPIDYEKAHEIMERAYECGINYFDTAYVYDGGDSEKCLGEWMKKHPRNSYYIASKWHINGNPDYKAVFDESLKRLQTDYIDFYLIHCIMDSTADKYIEGGGIEYLLEQQKLGRIKYLGFSSHASAEVLEKFASHHQWDFAQIQLNYFDWNYDDTEQEYNILAKRNIPIMVMEPVRGGRLAALSENAVSILKASHPEWSNPAWALRFVKRLPGVQVILSGMSTLDQMNDNLTTFADDSSLTDTELETLNKACAAFKSQVQVPCTGCRYCTEGCPMQINIPEYLTLYNSYKVDGKNALRGADSIQSEGNPSDCIGCGACTAACPQNIDTPSIMSELAELL